MSRHDLEYNRLARQILDYGEVRTDRTGVGTKALFGTQMRFDLQEGFPLLTTKRVYWKGIVEELLWFLRGETNVRSLQAKGVHIWDEWADENGDLGPVYGKQWRSWPTNRMEIDVSIPFEEYWPAPRPVVIDQIANVIEGLKRDPYGRRHIVSAWNPAEVDEMKLPPCHVLFQFDVSASGRLNCQLYQRSADFFLGVPFNIASYALLTHMVAHLTGYEPGVFTWVGGNTHLYLNHLDQIREQLDREPHRGPTLSIKPGVRTIDTFEASDIELHNYRYHPAIAAPVAV